MSKNKNESNNSGTETGKAAAVVAPESLSPLERIQVAIDATPKAEMADWAIEILCQATHQTGYRPIFRAAAEQRGEAGIYRLLQVMIQSTKSLRHNPLCLAASQAVAAARVQGKGILPADQPGDLLPALIITNKVAKAAHRRCSLLELETAPAAVQETA